MTQLKVAALFFCFAVMTFTTFGQRKKFNAALSKQIDSLRNADQSPLKMKNADSAAKEFQKIIRSNLVSVYVSSLRMKFIPKKQNHSK